MTLRLLTSGSLATALGLAASVLSSPGVAATPTRFPRPTLVSVTAQHLGTVDRVVLGFRNGLPAVYPAWIDTLRADGSGKTLRVGGAQILALGLPGATAHDHGATVRTRKAFALPNVITSVVHTDFEQYVTVALGVQERTSYSVTKLHNPDRVVIDVRADFPTTMRNIWLVDTRAAATGTGPTFVARPRPVRSDAPGAAALHALFAGPTLREKAAGLRLERSRAWGFSDLAIADGVARVRLTRRCSSGGSTSTVAGEVLPTLRQFPTVSWVKIYGPGGATEQPDGDVDSIPACLET